MLNSDGMWPTTFSRRWRQFSDTEMQSQRYLQMWSAGTEGWTASRGHRDSACSHMTPLLMAHTLDHICALGAWRRCILQ
ncbi:hypothetical protein PoB_005238000 [Plakobranchus ocellatus]|uniref:Uncharacterized protein n=1 Tax=Plakobranchus ocellatus TaxID=259542 RepID=A0AAV4C399_9GAST|nr:hypothetical protein PoB_005238000 [Plakobranchus ocellatus]